MGRWKNAQRGEHRRKFIHLIQFCETDEKPIHRDFLTTVACHFDGDIAILLVSCSHDEALFNCTLKAEHKTQGSDTYLITKEFTFGGKFGRESGEWMVDLIKF